MFLVFSIADCFFLLCNTGSKMRLKKIKICDQIWQVSGNNNVYNSRTKLYFWNCKLHKINYYVKRHIHIKNEHQLSISVLIMIQTFFMLLSSTLENPPSASWVVASYPCQKQCHKNTNTINLSELTLLNFGRILSREDVLVDITAAPLMYRL